MYIATRELELQTRKAQPGEQVPEALTWSYPVLLAHVNMGWLKFVDDGASEEEKQIVKTAQSKITQEAGEVFRCGHCEKEFKSERALKIHVTTAHKK
jgi:hypothetical protein